MQQRKRKFKHDAVARLGFGVMDKLFMELDVVPAAKPEGGGGGGQPLAASTPPEFPFLHMARPTGGAAARDGGCGRRRGWRGQETEQRERERGRRKRQGQECHFTTVLSPQPAATGS